MHGELPVFRPPSEAQSLIIRVAQGCPWNGCTFCGMYKGVRYRAHTLEEITREIGLVAGSAPRTQRVFLADGDAMALPFDQLGGILRALAEHLPELTRVSAYANGRSILDKTEDQLLALRRDKLHTLYMGLESGDDETLRRVKKRETAEEMVRACRLAGDCGLRMSVMVLTGLAGRERTREHAEATAVAVNGMAPRFLSALRIIPVPGTQLHGEICRGEIHEVSEYDAVAEVRRFVAGIELSGTVFRANHTSNIVPLAGRFPGDKARLLDELDQLLASGVLDRNTPGWQPSVL